MRRRARGDARSHIQTAPRHRIAPMFPFQTPFLVQTLDHRPCCPCPAHVPHMSPPVPLVSLLVAVHAPLCLVAPVSAIFVIVLALLVVAIGSRPLRPSPLSSGVLSLLFFLAMGAACALAFMAASLRLLPRAGEDILCKLVPSVSSP